MLTCELEDNINNIQCIIEKVSPQWEERINAMKDLLSLCKNFNNPSVFINELDKLNQYIVIQLKDLRSKVIIEVCNVLKELVVILGSLFESSGIYLFPQLFKLLSNKKEVFNKPAYTTIQYILLYTNSQKLFDIIFQYITNHSSSVNIKAFSFLCIQYYIENISSPPGLLSNNIDNLIHIISSGFNNSSPLVRTNCSYLYWILYKYYPKELDNIYNSLSSSKQDRLLQLQNKQNTENQQNISINDNNNHQKKQPIKSTNKIPSIRSRILQTQQTKNSKNKQSNDIIIVSTSQISYKDIINKNNWQEKIQKIQQLNTKWQKQKPNDIILNMNIISNILLYGDHPKVLYHVFKSLDILLKYYNEYSLIKIDNNNENNDLGLLCSLCYYSINGLSLSIRKASIHILYVLQEYYSYDILYNNCILLLKQLLSLSNDINDYKTMMRGCISFIKILNNKYMNISNKEEIYSNILDILLILLNQDKDYKEYIKQVLLSFYHNDTLVFCSIINNRNDIILLRTLLSPEIIFSNNDIKIYTDNIQESYDNINQDNTKYNINNLCLLLQSNKTKDIITVCKILQGNITKDTNINDSSWFIDYPCIYNSLYNTLYWIKNENIKVLYDNIESIKRILNIYTLLYTYFPKYYSLLLESSIQDNLKVLLKDIEQYKIINNCSNQASCLLSLI